MLKLLYTISILCLTLANTMAQNSDSLSQKYYETAPKMPGPLSPKIIGGPIERSMISVTEFYPTLIIDSCQNKTYDEKKMCSDMALNHFIQSNLQYPKEAREMGQEGKVFIRVIINEEGKMENIELAKNMTNSDLLAKEAIRLIEKLNEEKSWEPGRQRHQAVKVRLIIPVVFKLNW